MEAVKALDWPFKRDPNFDLKAFAARSFGVFWDGDCFEVEWRFKPEAAEDARRYRFHPDQVVFAQPDGSVVVQFTASGLNEMAWHLFTWGDSVEIVRPEALKVRYTELLSTASEALHTSSEGCHVES